MKWWVVALVFALVLINFYVFFVAPKGPYKCLADACIYAPDEQIRNLLKREPVYIIGEGDVNKTQKTAYVAKAMAQLALDFGHRPLRIYGAGFDGGKLKICLDENGSSVDLSLCQRPPAEGVVLWLRYPDASENAIRVRGNVIEFTARTGPDMWALVVLFEDQYTRR